MLFWRDEVSVTNLDSPDFEAPSAQAETAGGSKLFLAVVPASGSFWQDRSSARKRGAGASEQQLEISAAELDLLYHTTLQTLRYPDHITGLALRPHSPLHTSRQSHL